MANYSNLKTAIENAVDWNNGDNEITGQNLLDILETIIDSLGAKYKFADVATPSSSITTPDEPLFYLAGEGTYTNFSGLSVTIPRGTLAIFYYDTAWHYTTVRTDSDAFFNVNQYLGTPSTTYTKANGRNAVPSALRSKGMIITYLTTNGWLIEQNLSTSGTWNADANWQTIGPVSVSQNTETGHIDIEIGGETTEVATGQEVDELSSFAELATQGINASITDAFTAASEQVATLRNNIILAKNGDSLEFTLKSCSYASSNTKHNAFARNAINPKHIAIGLATNYVSVRADDSTWVIEKSASLVGNTIKISYENNNIVLYINGEVAETYSEQKPLTISSFGDGSRGGENYGYWDGAIENLKINGILISLKELCSSFTAVETIAIHKLSSEDISNIQNIPNIETELSSVKRETYLFDSSESSYIELTTPIVLEEEGDSLEFVINNVHTYYGDDTNKSYSFARNPNNNAKIALGLSARIFAVRADDGTWLVDIAQLTDIVTNGDSIKIIYEDGNVNAYVSGRLIGSYNGQKKVTISSFGNGSQGGGNYGYWDGSISNLMINGDVYPLSFNYSTNHNVEITTAEDSYPQYMVQKTATLIELYIHQKDGVYIGYPINYRYKAYTENEYPSFYDNWGVGRAFTAQYDKDTNTMTFIQYLFNPGEAELAVETPNVKAGESGQPTYKFSGGGANHGFENIVVESNNRKVMLLLNNISYAEDSVIPLKEIKTFDFYIQTQIYQAYTNENPYGLVTKHWFVEDGKFQIRTTMKMLRSIYLNQSEFGMFCIYRHIEGNISKGYLTNRAIENDDIFKVYDVTDGWESESANNRLKTNNYNCTKIIQYGETDMAFAIEIVDANTISPNESRNGGGMSMATNGNNPYNKVYFDLTGHYTPNVDDLLYATQVWSIK